MAVLKLIVENNAKIAIKAHVQTAKTKESPLLSAPAEVRNRIYELVLGGNALHIHISKWHKHSCFSKTPSSMSACVADENDEQAIVKIKKKANGYVTDGWVMRHLGCKVSASNKKDPDFYSVALLLQ